MGRSTTPKYRVEVAQAGLSPLRVAWPGDHFGKPTDAKLAQWVADYEASLKPGGVNAHVGYAPVLNAKVVNQKQQAVAAEYHRGDAPLPASRI